MEIRLITEGEEEQCNEFHNRVYKKSRTMAQWKWDFALNNYDRSPIPYAVVEDKGRIVGTQAFIPIRMIDKDGVYWTAKSEETLVDPDYRGKQLFEKMYALLFDYARDHNLASIWGFTPAIKAFVRLGFSVPSSTEQLFMPFSSRSVPVMMGKGQYGKKVGKVDRIKVGAARAGSLVAQVLSSMKVSSSKRRIARDLDIRTMEVPDEQSGDLCQRFIEKYGGTTIYRDAEYIRWRLFENPYVRSVVRAVYEGENLLGWTAFTLGDDGMGYLVDLMVACDGSAYVEEDVVRALLLESVIGTRNMGATGIRGWRVNSHPFDMLISRLSKEVGFYHIKRGHAVVIYDCDAGKQRVSSDRFDDWFVSRIFTEGVLG